MNRVVGETHFIKWDKFTSISKGGVGFLCGVQKSKLIFLPFTESQMSFLIILVIGTSLATFSDKRRVSRFSRCVLQICDIPHNYQFQPLMYAIREKRGKMNFLQVDDFLRHTYRAITASSGCPYFRILVSCFKTVLVRDTDMVVHSIFMKLYTLWWSSRCRVAKWADALICTDNCRETAEKLNSTYRNLSVCLVLPYSREW